MSDQEAERGAKEPDAAVPSSLPPPLPPMPKPTAVRRSRSPSDRARRSLLAGAIGLLVGLLSTLVVVSINSTLTGGEGDLGPGLVMLMVGVFALVAVPSLAIVAVKNGLSALLSGSTTGLRGQAVLGVALGTVGIIAVIAVIATAIALSVGRWGAPARDCPEPATAWIDAFRETWDPENRNAVVTESGFEPIGGNYYVAIRFENLKTSAGGEVPDATVILGTDGDPLDARLGNVWAASTTALDLGLEFRSGERAPDFVAARVVSGCLSV